EYPGTTPGASSGNAPNANVATRSPRMQRLATPTRERGTRRHCSAPWLRCRIRARSGCAARLACRLTDYREGEGKESYGGQAVGEQGSPTPRGEEDQRGR